MLRTIHARERHVGGFPVLRALPTRECRTVGPFCFLDELGPVVLEAGRGLDVPSHPHIGLSTLTYRLSGELIHRDSLGCTQPILPGAVNWMTAGSGVTHSERSAPSERDPEVEIHGVQLWVALPPELEDCEPSFEHQPAEALPRVDLGVAEATVVAGEVFGARSPVRVTSELFCAEVRWAADGEVELAAELGERAAWPLVGEVRAGGATHGRGELLVFDPGQPVRVGAAAGTRLFVFGGPPREAPLHMHWNYVASDTARIDAAKRRWAEGGFAPVVGEGDERAEDPTWRPA